MSEPASGRGREVVRQGGQLPVRQVVAPPSITVTLDVYGHLFPGSDADLAERLDGLWAPSELVSCPNGVLARLSGAQSARVASGVPPL
jgi:hypothetical protein